MVQIFLLSVEPSVESVVLLITKDLLKVFILNDFAQALLITIRGCYFDGLIVRHVAAENKTLL